MNDAFIGRKRITRITWIVALLLVVVMAGAHGIFAADIVKSGTCGNNLTWTLDSDGLLTIEGSGSMKDYLGTGSKTAPWDSASIKSVVIGEGVTSIGEWAFNNCSSLTSITIPKGVLSIGYGAFVNCSSLTSITIPESVLSIDYSAFYNCSSLTDITIPESVTSIGEKVFHGCSSLTSITIPDGVTYIGFSAFDLCSSLTSITIPAGVTSIGDYAFYNCSSLTSITIPNSVTSIGYYAFEGCSSLTEFHIPNIKTWIEFQSVAYIENEKHLFKDGIELTSITIPDSVTSIGDYAFYNCSSLTSITISDSVTSIGSNAFTGCNNATFIFLGDAPSVYGPYYGYSATFDYNTLLMIPYGNDTWTYPRWNGYPVAYFNTPPEDNNTLDANGYNRNGVRFTLDESAFTATVSESNRNESGIVIIPNRVTKNGVRYTVTSIGCDAFANAYLKQIVIRQSVESIEDDAFIGCPNLESIIVEPGNKYFSADNDILYNIDKTTLLKAAQSVSNVQIPCTVTKVNPNAFWGCRKLRSLTIPNTVTEIGNNILYGCSSLESLTVPFIGDQPKTQNDQCQYPLGWFFSSGSSSGSSNYEGFTTIAQYYYQYGDTPSSSYYCIPTSLRSVTVTGENLLYGAFYNCSMIEEITLGKDVVFTGERVFYGCSSLERINVNKNNAALASDSNGVLYSKDYKTIKCYPSGKKNVSFQIDNRVEAIDEFAFYNCLNLESLYVPETVTEIPINSIAYYDLTMFVYRGSAAEAYAKFEDIAYKYIGEGKAKNVRVTSEYNLPVIASGEEKGSVIGDYDGVAGVVSDSTINYDGTKSGLQTVMVTYDGETIETEAVVYDPVKEHFFDFGDVKEIQNSERGLAGMFDGNGRFLGLSEVIVLENHETVLIPNEVYEEAVEAKLMVIDANSFAPTGESVEEGL